MGVDGKFASRPTHVVAERSPLLTRTVPHGAGFPLGRQARRTQESECRRRKSVSLT